jgi:hypothetical protein
MEPPRPRRITDTAFDLPAVPDDRPHMIPGFDRDEDDADRTQVISADETQVLPPPDDTPPPPPPPSGRRGRRR